MTLAQHYCLSLPSGKSTSSKTAPIILPLPDPEADEPPNPSRSLSLASNSNTCATEVELPLELVGMCSGLLTLRRCLYDRGRWLWGLHLRFGIAVAVGRRVWVAMEENLLASGVLLRGSGWGGLYGADASNFRNGPVVETVLVLRVSVAA